MCWISVRKKNHMYHGCTTIIPTWPPNAITMWPCVLYGLVQVSRYFTFLFYFDSQYSFNLDSQKWWELLLCSLYPFLSTVSSGKLKTWVQHQKEKAVAVAERKGKVSRRMLLKLLPQPSGHGAKKPSKIIRSNMILQQCEMWHWHVTYDIWSQYQLYQYQCRHYQIWYDDMIQFNDIWCLVTQWSLEWIWICSQAIIWFADAV